MLQVEVWSDIACPWCHVGKRRFEQALAGFPHADGVTITWRSFELDPTAPAVHDEPQPVLLARKYGTSVAQAEAMNARMTSEAAREGLTFHLDRTRVGNTFDAHRLLHHAAAQHGAAAREALMERLFTAYLRDGEALGDHDTLARLCNEAGLDAEPVSRVLHGTAYADDVRRDEARARSLGVTGVPFFVFDSRYGVSGAQPPETLRDALDTAWREANMPLQRRESTAGRDDGSPPWPAASCDEDGCAI